MITLIKGGSHTDGRGTIRFVNGFDMSPVKRFYIVTHPDTSVVRAWQGHKEEAKYFTAVRGSFLVCGVKIDNFVNPSGDLPVEKFILTDSGSSVLHIPAGYANGIKALEAGSELLVFSDKSMEEAKDDQVRFDSSLWFDWNKY